MKPIHAALAIVLAGAFCQATAQTVTPIELPADAPARQGELTPAQIEQLVAPIALYPDPVLTDILAAATYPAQVVEAARFAAANEGLQGVALADAAAGHQWDASVQALLMFPSVLHMLDGNLEWTDQLGRAFVTQQGEVMNAIQRLRQDAERAGTLQNSPSASVVNEGGAVSINPPTPDAVYLPSYDASCVYGDVAGCGGVAYPVGWDAGVFLPYGFGQWGLLDWRHRSIREYHHGGAGWGAGDEGGWRHQDQAGAPWHHASGVSGFPAGQGLPGFSGGISAPSADHYLYAPPAGVSRPGYGIAAPAMMPAHFAPPGAFHGGGTAVAPRMARVAAPASMAVHGGGGSGGHR